MTPILGYWKIRGLAQPIRLLLGYTKTDFVDKTYESGAAPEYDRTSWLSVKYTLGLDFPNLPYFIDGDVKLTQSNAIIQYIARKNNMDGNTEKEKYRIDMMVNELMDFRMGFATLCYRTKPEDLDQAVKDYKTNVQSRLKLFEDFLGDFHFLAGNKLTFVDFIFYELLDIHKVFQEDILASFPKLEAFVKRFEAIPEIHEYMMSEKFFKGPLNGPMALIGGK
ncbi:glutathione S-transferase Mu 5 isoform X1 [Hydra vulgaris]|uniref:glutathione S-transferase Mu 5 isoform X1 n=1 Tax=Hydra vulgaris TaxID=6087 RepID=UPI0001927983|nr:glutathione S-transferase Mu 5-like [Hydra vulgaris]XP_047132961.1 glutathione S-transferase Mu 5-like [Hydra vulgaris]XP_047132962.1 glutathione S-transferase Mu 5-like [Hydra vulgaris]XP_047132963.1 glutathione S-transferase Mu 5-like [Hydra vulgaris]